MRILFALFSLFTWFEIILLFILISPLHILCFLITGLFDKNRRLFHYMGSVVAAIALFISPIFRVRITGKEHLNRKKAHVIIMNHQSLLDILLAFRLFYPAKMIGKHSVGKVPFLGWSFILGGHILVNRTKRKSQLKAMHRMDTILQNGDSLLVYPEGTRTRDGNLLPFKKGAFRAATRNGTPVLPVVIDGAFQGLPKGGLVASKVHTLHVQILPPIPVEKNSSTSELALQCKDVMEKELVRIRKENS